MCSSVGEVDLGEVVVAVLIDIDEHDFLGAGERWVGRVYGVECALGPFVEAGWVSPEGDVDGAVALEVGEGDALVGVGLAGGDALGGFGGAGGVEVEPAVVVDPLGNGEVWVAVAGDVLGGDAVLDGFVARLPGGGGGQRGAGVVEHEDWAVGVWGDALVGGDEVEVVVLVHVGEDAGGGPGGVEGVGGVAWGSRGAGDGTEVDADGVSAEPAVDGDDVLVAVVVDVADLYIARVCLEVGDPAGGGVDAGAIAEEDHVVPVFVGREAVGLVADGDEVVVAVVVDVGDFEPADLSAEFDELIGGQQEWDGANAAVCCVAVGRFVLVGGGEVVAVGGDFIGGLGEAAG